MKDTSEVVFIAKFMTSKALRKKSKNQMSWIQLKNSSSNHRSGGSSHTTAANDGNTNNS